MKSPSSRAPGANPHPKREAPPPQGECVSRKERELLRHRVELLEAAERLLGKMLLHELTIQHIAAESEFSVGYIYKLFDSKAEIIAALIKDKLRALRAVIDDSTARSGPWEVRAENLLEAFSDWLERTPMYGSRVTPHLKDFAHNHPAVAAEFASFLEFYRNSIETLFSDAIRAGRLSEDEPGQAARSFRALLAGFSEEVLLHHPDSPGTLRHEAPLIVHIIKRAFAPQGGDA
jgi:AcrR family transcriptional regulator